MIVSNKSKQSNSRWLQVCVLLFALVVLPFGIASAQDYKAVERRLGEAVSKGELKLEQAVVMMDALRKAGGAEKDQGSDRAEAYLMKVKKELGELVEAGRISKEDAVKRYEGAKKGIKERMAAGLRQRTTRGDMRAEYEGFEQRIKAAVRAGRMTREEAGKQLEGFRRRMEMAERGERGERRITVEEYRRAEEKMRKMVEEGKAKPEDVERRLIEMRRMMGEQREHGERRITREDFARAEAELKKFVDEGKISQEDMRARLGGMRRMMGQQRERGERRITREDYARAEAELKKFVDEGKISQEDAKARLNGMRKMMAGQSRRQRGGERQRTTRGDKRSEYEGFERRIKAAVEAGKMTREQAREKLEDYKKRIGR